MAWFGEGSDLDRAPELQDLYFANYTHLYYLQQLPDHDESARAKEAAERMGVEYLHLDTGLDVLEQRLVAIVEQFENEDDAA